MQVFQHVFRLMTERLVKRSRQPWSAASAPTTAPRSPNLQQAQVLAMQKAIDGRWQLGVATGIEMARWELTAPQASSHLADVANRSGISIQDVARVVVAEGFPSHD